MDEPPAPRASDGHPLQAPHRPWTGPLPEQFVALRLELEDGQILDVHQPEVVVGRHSQADVRLALTDVSRRHCRLFFQGGCWRVQDLASLNGILVNEERMLEAPLYDGDRLRVGGFTFTIRYQPAAKPGDSQEEMLRTIFEALPRKAS